MKESTGADMAAWSGSGLAATGGYYSYDHSTLAAYGWAYQSKNGNTLHRYLSVFSIKETVCRDGFGFWLHVWVAIEIHYTYIFMFLVLKRLSHEMDLDFDDIGDGAIF